MSEPKFTPWPWKMFLTGDERAIYIGTDLFGERSSVAATVDVDICGKEIEHLANANLIAAAPDLYEALRMAVKDLRAAAFMISPEINPAFIETVKRADSALAKARGE